MNFEQFLEANISDKFSYIVEEDKKEEKKEDKKAKDAICMNSSLFMRVLELVREDVEDDEVLHHLVEKITDLCKDSDEPLTMDAYDEIEKVVEEENEDDEEDDDEKDSSEDQEDEGIDESKKCDCDDDEKLEEVVDEDEEKCEECKDSDKE